MSKPDGGPAFPRNGVRLIMPHSLSNHPDIKKIEFHQDGLSLRDYFAAHAPTEKWKHFRPNVLPKPINISNDVFFELDLIEQEKAKQAWYAWCEEFQIQSDIQWPWFYSDAMIAERGK